MTRAVLVSALFGALVASGAPRIAIRPFKGPQASRAKAQLENALCDDFQCVEKKKGAAAAVSGQVSKSKKKLSLTVKVMVGDQVAMSQKYPLQGNGTLAARTLRSLLKNVNSALSMHGSDDPPAPAPEPADSEDDASDRTAFAAAAPVSEPMPTPVAAETERPAMESTERPEGSSSDEVVVSKTVGDAARRGQKDPLLALQAGSDVFNRDFSFVGTAPTNVRTWKAAVLVAPHVRLEVRPLTGRFGVGLEGDFLTVVGSKSRKPGDDTAYPTSLNRIDAAARFNLRPFDRSLTRFGVGAGYRMSDFSVGTNADGATLDGVPAISYRAARVSANFDVPLTEALGTFGECAYLHVLSSGELTSDGYFAGGRAFGVEANAGARYSLGGGFELRGVAQLTRYMFTFPVAEGADTTKGATDQYLGGALNLRYSFL